MMEINKMKIKKIKSKKGVGFFTSEAVTFILGILAVVLLIILATKLYGMFIKKTDMEQARETFEQIVSKINSLKEGEQTNYLILAPEGWSLLSDEKTLYLGNINSIKFGSSNEKEKAIGVCTRQGFLETFNFDVEISHSCLFNSIDNCFNLEELPISFYLKKEEGVLKILTKEDLVSISDFEGILELNGENAKTLRELCLEYSVSEDKRIKEEIKKLLDSYFEDFDSKKLLSIDKENFIWIFWLLKKEVVVGKEMYLTIFGESSEKEVFSGEPVTSNSYEFDNNGKDYKIVINYYNRVEVSSVITNI